jgi:hypothetical protein
MVNYFFLFEVKIKSLKKKFFSINKSNKKINIYRKNNYNKNLNLEFILNK